MNIDIKHHFSAGVYIRQQHLQATGMVATHKHSFSHFGLLGKGVASVEVDDNETIYEAPAVIDIKANKHHRITALTDITWFCIHATNETDVEKIDHVLVAKES